MKRTERSDKDSHSNVDSSLDYILSNYLVRVVSIPDATNWKFSAGQSLKIQDYQTATISLFYYFLLLHYSNTHNFITYGIGTTDTNMISSNCQINIKEIYIFKIYIFIKYIIPNKIIYDKKYFTKFISIKIYILFYLFSIRWYNFAYSLQFFIVKWKNQCNASSLYVALDLLKKKCQLFP